MNNRSDGRNRTVRQITHHHAIMDDITKLLLPADPDKAANPETELVIRLRADVQVLEEQLSMLSQTPPANQAVVQPLPIAESTGTANIEVPTIMSVPEAQPDSRAGATAVSVTTCTGAALSIRQHRELPVPLQ